MTWNLHKFATSATLVTELADRLCSDLQQDIAARGAAGLIVSGGSTPVPLFETLSSRDLDWSRVQITLADERWVDDDDPDSNAALVARHLLQNRAAASHYIDLYNGMDSPFSAESAIDQRLAEFPWPASAVILGMGSDGHTASLFPGSSQLQQALIGTQAENSAINSRCCAVQPLTVPQQRMTLTWPALMDTRALYLHIQGHKKKQVLEQAMQLGAIDEYPIRAFLHQKKQAIEIYLTED